MRRIRMKETSFQDCAHRRSDKRTTAAEGTLSRQRFSLASSDPMIPVAAVGGKNHHNCRYGIFLVS